MMRIFVTNYTIDEKEKNELWLDIPVEPKRLNRQFKNEFDYQLGDKLVIQSYAAELPAEFKMTDIQDDNKISFSFDEFELLNSVMLLWDKSDYKEEINAYYSIISQDSKKSIENRLCEFGNLIINAQDIDYMQYSFKGIEGCRNTMSKEELFSRTYKEKNGFIDRMQKLCDELNGFVHCYDFDKDGKILAETFGWKLLNYGAVSYVKPINLNQYQSHEIVSKAQDMYKNKSKKR